MSDARAVFGLIVVAVCIGVPAYAIHSCSTFVAESDARRLAAASASNASVEKTPLELARELEIERFNKIDTLDAAIAYSLPSMQHAVGTNPGDGTVLLAMWVAGHYNPFNLWADLQRMPDNPRAAILADFRQFLGKKLCSRGTIVEIEADRDHRETLWSGGLRVGELGVVRFATIGTPNTLVEGSPARLCGIVTGLLTFQNQLGSTTTAVEVVGTFDSSE